MQGSKLSSILGGVGRTLLAATEPSTLTRQAVLYTLFCASTGASLPFMPLWLGAHGLSPTQIAWILAAPLLGRAVTGPMIALWAERFSKARTPIAFLAGMAFAAYTAMGITGSLPINLFWSVLVLYGIGTTGFTSIAPFLDTMTLQLAQVERFAFGIARACGSASYVFANVGLGMLITVIGTPSVAWWMAITAFLTMMTAASLLPAHEPVRIEHNSREPASATSHLGRLLFHNQFWLLLLTLGVLQAAHSFYYAFSTILWQREGLSPGICGLLWATGVVAELVLLLFGAGLRRRIGPARLLIIGAGAGVIRWALLALSPPLILLWPLQLLHGLSFTAVYVAGLELIQRTVPPGFERLGQTINSAYGSGVLMGLVTFFSGILFDAEGAGGYMAMAIGAVIGLAGAVCLALGPGQSSAKR